MRAWIHLMRTGAVVLVSIGVIAVLLIWLAGGFHEKIEPGPTEVGVLPLGQARTLIVEPATQLAKIWSGLGFKRKKACMERLQHMIVDFFCNA